jgi:hypothetical protein
MNTTFKTHTYFFNINGINSFKQLSTAIRHNKREIQKELGARSNIDASKTHLNFSLVTSATTEQLVRLIKSSIDKHQVQTCRRMRRDAVIALEIVFSIPSSRTDIQVGEFFKDCLEWTKSQFVGADLLTADVHLDEANPHMHVILLCVTPTKLIGSSLKGNKVKYVERGDSFFQVVGLKYGFNRPLARLHKADRIDLAKMVTSELESSGDPATKSPIYELVKRQIELNPVQYAQSLGIEVQQTLKKMRTMAQIMTSKGKGRTWQPEE